MTTPLEREVLTHYYVSPEPWPRLNIHNRDLIDRFVKAGLLRLTMEPNAYGSYVEGVREALEPYMEALAAVPLPVQRWVVP